jgi:hypothetical protein
MLLAALPVREAPRLVNLSASGPNPGSQWCTRAGDCDVKLRHQSQCPAQRRTA